MYLLTLSITVQKEFASLYENIFLNVSILNFFFTSYEQALILH